MSSFLFKGLKQKWLSQGPAVKPIVPLILEKQEDPEDDKSKFVSMEVKNRTDGKTTYKMHLRLFEEGSPQQWLALMHDIKIVWTQNGLSKPSDRIACLHAVLRGESKTAFEAALVELAVDEDGHMDLKNEHVELALKEVGKEVFPRRALELQRLWMLRYMRKPKHLSIRKTVNAITKMNNSLPLFPGGEESSKFPEQELVGLIEWSLPPIWRAKFDLDNYIPTLDTKARLIEECEAIERNLGPDDDGENKKKKGNKKTKTAKTGGGGSKRDRGEKDKHLFCKRCGRNGTHTTQDCRILKKEQAGAEKKEEKRPFTKRTFRKEANAIARKAAKKGSLSILAKSLAKEQSKAKKRAGQQKKSKSDKDADSDSDSDSGSESEESVHVIDVPRKTLKIQLKAAQKTRSEDTTMAEAKTVVSEKDLKILVAKRQKELSVKNRKKRDTVAAEEAAFLQATAEKAKEMEVEEEASTPEPMDAE
jgi:hypothetical protein